MRRPAGLAVLFALACGDGPSSNAGDAAVSADASVGETRDASLRDGPVPGACRISEIEEQTRRDLRVLVFLGGGTNPRADQAAYGVAMHGEVGRLVIEDLPMPCLPAAEERCDTEIFAGSPAATIGWCAAVSCPEGKGLHWMAEVRLDPEPSTYEIRSEPVVYELLRGSFAFEREAEAALPSVRWNEEVRAPALSLSRSLDARVVQGSRAATLRSAYGDLGLTVEAEIIGNGLVEGLVVDGSGNERGVFSGSTVPEQVNFGWRCAPAPAG